MTYTKKQNKKMIKYFISKIKENIENLESTEEFEKVNSLVASNKLLLDSIETIKNHGLEHYRFDAFRNEIDAMIK